MRIFLKHLGEPLNSIRIQPYQFTVWWIVAVVFGLAGFWLPMLLTWAYNKDAHEVFVSLMRAGSLASFSVVLLAEGLAAALVAQGAGTSLVAAGLRGLVSIFALLIVFVQVGFLAVQTAMSSGPPPSSAFQLTITSFAVLFASYLYCFRFADWEKGIEFIREEGDRTVGELAESAKQASTDDKGVRL